MTPPPCRLLDDYLTRDLGGADRARFTAHLPGCPDCRRAVRAHERLGAVLTAATTELEPVPAGLIDRIERRLRAARRRRLVALAAALLAAAVALGQFARFTPRPGGPELPRVQVQPAPPTEVPRPDRLVRVRFP